MRTVVMGTLAGVLALGACGPRQQTVVDGGGTDTRTETGSGVDVRADTPMAGDAAADVDDAAIDDVAADVAIDSVADVGAPDVATRVDLDMDGLDDAFEDRIAHEYLPYRSFHTDESCPLQMILYRVRPHPSDATLLHLVVNTLLQNDCGAGGHVGDDEVFGMTVNPALPAPMGIVAIRAISHQGTACQHISDCGRCSGLSACDTAMRGGMAFPVVYYSRDKHGAYMSTSSCNAACFFTNYCNLSSTPSEPPMLNAGEPMAPMTRNLTTSGMITSAAGWTETSLFDFDPWSGNDFGGAGNVASDMDDPAFLTPACP